MFVLRGGGRELWRSKKKNTYFSLFENRCFCLIVLREKRTQTNEARTINNKIATEFEFLANSEALQPKTRQRLYFVV